VVSFTIGCNENILAKFSRTVENVFPVNTEIYNKISIGCPQIAFVQ